MGCDIHAFLEYFNTEDKEPWVDSFASSIGFHRNYNLFNAMAGVRGFGGPFDPRGLPHNPKIGMFVFNEYYLKIVDSKSQAEYFINNTITKEEAQQAMDQYNIIEEDYNGSKYIRNPSWHSASHLGLGELITVRRKYLIDALDYDCTYKGKKRKEVLSKLENSNEYELMKLSFPEIECAPLNATIASMIAIENSGPYKSRLVFWFDS
jgi:hypothetical protein